MAVLGGTALHQELATPGSVSTAVARDYSLGVVAVLQNLAAPAISTAIVGIAAFLLFTWLITSLDSATLVVGQLLAWQMLTASGNGVTANPANAFFYFMTGAHALHILVRDDWSNAMDRQNCRPDEDPLP